MRRTDAAYQAQSTVYVHCRAGQSRSVVAVVAYLMHARHWSWSRAYDFVVAQRNQACPNLGFVHALMAFEQILPRPAESWDKTSTARSPAIRRTTDPRSVPTARDGPAPAPPSAPTTVPSAAPTPAPAPELALAFALASAPVSPRVTSPPMHPLATSPGPAVALLTPRLASPLAHSPRGVPSTAPLVRPHDRTRSRQA